MRSLRCASTGDADSPPTDVESVVRTNASSPSSLSSTDKKNSAVAYRLTRPSMSSSSSSSSKEDRRADDDGQQLHKTRAVTDNKVNKATRTRRNSASRRPESDSSTMQRRNNKVERAVACARAPRDGGYYDECRGDVCEDDDDYMGFSEEWEVEMVRFWRCWNMLLNTNTGGAREGRNNNNTHTVRESDIARLVRLGRTDEAFARVDLVAAGAKKLSTLLPDAHVPNMLQREPEIVDLNFVRASQSILELQTVLCSSDHCSDVTAILERCPRLLLCDDIKAEVDAAKSRLQELAPECDAQLAVSEYPELIYRLKNYDQYTELPISIQNIIAETSVMSEAEVYAAEEYNSRWDEWERRRDLNEEEGGGEEGLVSDAYGDKGLGDGDWMNAAESAEWMLDGYWEAEE